MINNFTNIRKTKNRLSPQVTEQDNQKDHDI